MYARSCANGSSPPSTMFSIFSLVKIMFNRWNNVSHQVGGGAEQKYRARGLVRFPLPLQDFPTCAPSTIPLHLTWFYKIINELQHRGIRFPRLLICIVDQESSKDNDQAEVISPIEIWNGSRETNTISTNETYGYASSRNKWNYSIVYDLYEFVGILLSSTYYIWDSMIFSR